MAFGEDLKKAMQDLGISQKQLAGMTGISKSCISQYLSGKNIPTEKRQANIAVSLGLQSDYFLQNTENTATAIKAIAKRNGIPKMMVSDAAEILGMHHNTVRKGLQQGVFPWGYAIKTSENRWTYFINAVRFAEIEGIALPGEQGDINTTVAEGCME